MCITKHFIAATKCFCKLLTQIVGNEIHTTSILSVVVWIISKKNIQIKKYFQKEVLKQNTGIK